MKKGLLLITLITLLMLPFIYAADDFAYNRLFRGVTINEGGGNVSNETVNDTTFCGGILCSLYALLDGSNQPLTGDWNLANNSFFIGSEDARITFAGSTNQRMRIDGGEEVIEIFDTNQFYFPTQTDVPFTFEFWNRDRTLTLQASSGGSASLDVQNNINVGENLFVSNFSSTNGNIQGRSFLYMGEHLPENVANYFDNFNNFVAILLRRSSNGTGDYLQLQNSTNFTLFTIEEDGNFTWNQDDRFSQIKPARGGAGGQDMIIETNNQISFITDNGLRLRVGDATNPNDMFLNLDMNGNNVTADYFKGNGSELTDINVDADYLRLDGGNSPTANIDWGNNEITNLAGITTVNLVASGTIFLGSTIMTGTLDGNNEILNDFGSIDVRATNDFIGGIQRNNHVDRTTPTTFTNGADFTMQTADILMNSVSALKFGATPSSIEFDLFNAHFFQIQVGNNDLIQYAGVTVRLIDSNGFHFNSNNANSDFTIDSVNVDDAFDLDASLDELQIRVDLSILADNAFFCQGLSRDGCELFNSTGFFNFLNVGSVPMFWEGYSLYSFDNDLKVFGNINITNNSITEILSLEFSNGDTITGNNSIQIDVAGSFIINETTSESVKFYINVPTGDVLGLLNGQMANTSSGFFGDVNNIDDINNQSRFKETNINNGTSASAGFVAENNLGHFVTFGIGSSNFEFGGNPFNNEGAILNAGPEKFNFANIAEKGWDWRSNVSGVFVESMQLSYDGNLNISNLTVDAKVNYIHSEQPDGIAGQVQMFCKVNDKCYIVRSDGTQRRLLDSGAGSEVIDYEITFDVAPVFSNLNGTYVGGQAHVCVYNNGTLFSSEAAC